MRIIGVDPSLTSTGIAVVEFEIGCRPGLIFAGRVRTTPKQSMPERLHEIACAIEYAAIDQRVHAAGVEMGFVMQAYRVALVLAQVRGAALLSLRAAGLKDIHDVNYAQAKKIIGVPLGLKRKEGKAAVQERVAVLIDGAQDLPDDEADAAATAYAVGMGRGRPAG